MKTLFDQNFFKSKWMTKIHSIFNCIGLRYIWNSESITLSALNKNLHQRLTDANLQHWSSDLEQNILCINYKIFKSDFGFEPYLSLLSPDLRIALCRYRCGYHNLPISNKRYEPIDDRNQCPLCQSDVGDEYHYLFSCPAFDTFREKYINKSFYTRPNCVQYKILMNSSSKKTLVNLSIFVKFILHVFRP